MRIVCSDQCAVVDLCPSFFRYLLARGVAVFLQLRLCCCLRRYFCYRVCFFIALLWMVSAAMALYRSLLASRRVRTLKLEYDRKRIQDAPMTFYVSSLVFGALSVNRERDCIRVRLLSRRKNTCWYFGTVQPNILGLPFLRLDRRWPIRGLFLFVSNRAPPKFALKEM